MNMNLLMTFLVMLPLAAVLLLSICAYGSVRRLAAFSLPSRHYASAAAPGLDPTAIQRLPVTVIAAETELEPSSAVAVAVTVTVTAKECSVCLSEFREGDKARALPPCGHAFHVECIDSWLIKHSTCPLCRNPVVVPSAPPPPPPGSPAESPTSTSADAARMTKAPPSVRGTADVAIHIDADMATLLSSQ